MHDSSAPGAGLSRRRFMSLSAQSLVLLGAATAVTTQLIPVTLLADEVLPEALPELPAGLLQMGRDIFPHDRLGDLHYAKPLAALLRDRHHIGPSADDDFSIRNLSELAAAVPTVWLGVLSLLDATALLWRLRLEDVPMIWGVPGSLLQVFVNLVTNAAHALEPSGGTVTLELAASGEHVAARVKDDGPGIPPDVRRRIFEPFFTTKPVGKGTGLGLSIVQGIVSRHGGAITVESEPGQGASFTVMLPVKNPA